MQQDICGLLFYINNIYYKKKKKKKKKKKEKRKNLFNILLYLYIKEKDN